MEIQTIRSGDNYIHLLLDGRRAAVVDPGNAALVERALADTGASLELVLITHHHGDHTGGCSALKRATGCRIVGPPGGARFDTQLQDGDSVPFAGTKLTVLSAPGHTRNDLAYHLPEANAVFTGDTLFACGCGRLFSRDAEAMWSSLCRLRSLPGETRVYVGHDYTEDNLQFAIHLDPDNAELQKRLRDYKSGSGSRLAPSTIAEERSTNPFFRCDTPELMAALKMQGIPPAEVFAEVRRRKDRW